MICEDLGDRKDRQMRGIQGEMNIVASTHNPTHNLTHNPTHDSTPFAEQGRVERNNKKLR